MSNRINSTGYITLAAAVFLVSGQHAWADNTSPNVRGGEGYSDEAPNVQFYGTGISGKLAEASALRFDGERDLDDGNIEAAIRKLGKAVKLDSGDPSTHMLYARAITKKLYRNKGPIDEELLDRCINEWKMLWHHDADGSEQYEARAQAKHLMKIARALQKQKLLKEKAQIAHRKEGKALVAETGESTQNETKIDSSDREN